MSLHKALTFEYLYLNDKKYFDRCVLGERLFTIEELSGVHRFEWLFKEQFRNRFITKYKEFFICNEEEEVWWYDDIGILCGTAGLLKIKGDQIVDMQPLLMS